MLLTGDEPKVNKLKIVLITTGQPAVNPRIVKEANALHAAGFDVTILYSFFIHWAQEKDKILLKNVLWKYKMLGGDEIDNKAFYFFTRLRCKISGILNKYFGNIFLLAERAQGRAYDELLQEAKNIKANWYIGHNLGALAIAVKAAKYNNAKAGFDFEDYHRGEGHISSTLKRIVFLEKKYVPFLSYYSCASELISNRTAKNHADFSGKVITLLNCFPLEQQPVFVEKAQSDNTLKLFWFSQTIGTNRGIELLLKAINIIENNSIHLTLAGRCNDDLFKLIEKNFSKQLNNIHFAGLIQPEYLPHFAAQFDVGLAIELTEPYNRNICLTNKIFTYLLAGNAIILSNTAMQSSFNVQYKVGESFVTNDAESLAEKIIFYLDIKKLNVQKKYNYELAKNKLNWENESKKLLEIIN